MLTLQQQQVLAMMRSNAAGTHSDKMYHACQHLACTGKLTRAQAYRYWAANNIQNFCARICLSLKCSGMQRTKMIQYWPCVNAITIHIVQNTVQQDPPDTPPAC